MPSVIIAGGGLAGLSAAAALGSAGFQVRLFESRAFLGGRATSFPITPADEHSEHIDNCQHVLLRCCVNLLDLYRRLGVEDRIRFHGEFYFVEPGGRTSILRSGVLPAPLHFTGSFLRMRCLGAVDKLKIAAALLAIRRERLRRNDLDHISMGHWLREKGQTAKAVERFWRPVLVSAVNEELDRMAARHAFQVFWLGFLAHSKSYEMGTPVVPLGDLYRPDSWQRVGDISIRFRSPVERIEIENHTARGVVVHGETHQADYYVCCLPFERLEAVAPALGIEASRFQHSPITGIHLWFDRSVTDLPHATLLDRTIQWMFNKSGGRYVQVVVSASRSLVEMSRADVISLALRELSEFFPGVREARLERAQVIKELRATYAAGPGTEALRPTAGTSAGNLFLAGDWTRSGWPATMEGAVRSGYGAAEAVSRAAGGHARFVLPDIA